MEKIELTHEMKQAYESVKNGKSTVILGSAGSGKSTFINYLENNGLKILKLAPTGVASANIKGSTIHKFFGFPPRLIELTKVAYLDYNKTNLVRGVDAILIDEISMVRSDLMDGIDRSLRKSMMVDYPFGGIPLIFMGDLSQLPPIVSKGAERDYFNFNYKSEFFFDSNIFTELEEEGAISFVNFSKIFRQKDEEFIKILNKIRFNTISQAELDELNGKCYLSAKKDNIVLCARNEEVIMINNHNLFDNENPYENYKGIVDGQFNYNNCIADYDLSVKIGCRVMILNNGEGYFNGSLGVYKGLHNVGDNTPPSMMVELDDSDGTIVYVPRYKYADVKQEYDKKENKITETPTGSMEQFPVKLGYAITVHKSQGLSFDKISIDLGRYGSFSHGQTYVAVSRCRTLEGLRLTKKITKKDIIIDPRVKKWLENYNLVL